jgi:hypothetical protein
MAKRVTDETDEPRNWKRKVVDPKKKHPGGRPQQYGFREMLLVLLLMVWSITGRKEYREMEAHLKNNPNLV